MIEAGTSRKAQESLHCIGLNYFFETTVTFSVYLAGQVWNSVMVNGAGEFVAYFARY